MAFSSIRNPSAFRSNLILFIATLVFFTPNAVFALTDISSCAELQSIDDDLAEDYQLTQDIDCSGVANFNIIGSSVAPFTGTFDGQDFTVDGVTISGSAGYEAPFARNGGTIQDVGFTNVDINSSNISSNAFVAGLVAVNNGGTIQNSYTTGTVVAAGWKIGGLVGSNENGSTIHQSYSSANMSGTLRVGGLVGQNSGSTITQSFATGNATGTSNQVGGLIGVQSGAGADVSNSYSTGNVTGNSSVGGFIGYSEQRISNSYTRSNTPAGDYGFGTSNGSFPATNSYWDGEVSSADATGSGALGTEKTTLQMKDQATYIGWNFSTIWGISSGANDGYPFLRFQDIDIPPTVSSLSPLDNATGVTLNSSLLITFTEAVDVETGNIVIYETSDDSIFATIDVTSGLVTGSGTTEITINPASDLVGGIEYYVQIDASAFDDATGNSYAGISDTTTWSFTSNMSLSYTTPNGYTVNTAITPLSPTVNGTVVSYGVSPALPTGLALSTSTGVISGTPTVATGITTYVVTVTNAIGNTTFDLSVTVSDVVGVVGNSGGSRLGLYKRIERYTEQKKFAKAQALIIEELVDELDDKKPNKNKIKRLITLYLSFNGGNKTNLDTENTEDHEEAKDDSDESTPKIFNVTRDLDLRDEGDDVTELQNFLIEKNTGPSAAELTRVSATGYFGNYTKNALGEFQKSVGIVPYAGYFGPITREYILSNY